ncbi:alpha-hydroxy acid oxidase [Variibacter gotjawalensis]|nr:alpha-hydroxy acid oxidase [Variibacter gotjawalensis]NIK47082.1 glycolate oxidase [Variibacter gotjawalensis]
MTDKPSDTSTADPRSASAAHPFQNLHEIIAKARQNLNQNDWDYIVGGTESETTLKRNRMALDTTAFRPRVLRDVSKVDCSTTLLGKKLRLPLMLAPVGSLEQFAEGGGATSARAAGEFGIAHMLSSVCQPGMEEVANAAPDAMRIYQLYVRGDAGWTDDHVKRAINNGYKAFCLTVDTAHYSRRERDLAKRHVTSGRRSVTQGGQSFQAGLDWSSVKRIKDNFDIPLILKGIATAEDAEIAVEHGVDWIYISNHGGRQLDHGLGSFQVLREVAKAVKGRAKLMVDGSFNRGTDVVKGIAAGADIVGLGRMQCYALSAGGIPAMHRMLELFEDEIQRSLGLLGVNTFAELDDSYLTSAPPVTDPHVLSAFPLLDVTPYRY